MAEAHLDHPGEMRWFPGKGPVPVLGPCPHSDCSHNAAGCVAYGPDYDHYVLDECQVPAEDGGCGGTCRAWMAEYPEPRNGVRYRQGPFLHVAANP